MIFEIFVPLGNLFVATVVVVASTAGCESSTTNFLAAEET
jgi:hypothetical protein